LFQFEAILRACTAKDATEISKEKPPLGWLSGGSTPDGVAITLCFSQAKRNQHCRPKRTQQDTNRPVGNVCL
jgi:hypothetical protein